MSGPVLREDLDGLARYSSVAATSAPVRVRASSNEAPGPSDPAVVAAICRAATDAGRYPAIRGADLVDRLTQDLGLTNGQVAVGAGALALLDRLLVAYVRPGDEVVMAWRSYEAYPLNVQVAGGRAVQVPLTPDGAHDLPAMLRAITPRTRAVLVCNPNNPTGTVVSWAALLAFLNRVPDDVVVIVDEAYIEYDDRPRPHQSGLPALLARGNVAVLRTFSKAYGLAGLRAGYVAAAPEIIAAVEAVSQPFPVSAVAAAAATACLDDTDLMRHRVLQTQHQRAAVLSLLHQRGYDCPASQGNFVWLPLGDHSGRFAEHCRAHGLLVRPFAGEGVRITVGDPLLTPLLDEVLDGWATSTPHLAAARNV